MKQQKHRQRSLPRACLVALYLCTLSSIAWAKEIKLEASVSQVRIFIGETTRLTLKVDGFKQGMNPDLSAIKDCSITPRGHMDQSIMSIVNGRRTGFSGRIFQYDIAPTRTGSIQLGPITVNHARGKTSIPGQTIAVRGVEAQQRVLLFLEQSKPEVIVDETFTVQLRVLVQKLPPPYVETSPLPSERPPRLHIPYLKNEAFEGLEGPNVEKLLNGMLIRNRRAPGLAVNDYTVESNPFDGFFNMQSLHNRQQPARFDFKPTTVNHNGLSYFEYKLPIDYVPTTEGTYTFGPVSFKGEVFVKATPSGQGITEPIFAVVEAKPIRVVAPPEEGRPASYVGAIGSRLVAKASLDAQTCKVGDPLTLKIDISGDIRLENLFAPRLSLQEDLGADFRIYEDSVHSETHEDSRLYRYTVRPSRAGTYEFPPVAISFYNTNKRSYDTILTDPIPIRANPATEVEQSIVIDTVEQSVTIVAEDTDPNLLVPAPIAMPRNIAEPESIFTARLHLPLLILGPILFLIGAALRAGRRLMPAVERRHRHATAADHVLERLQHAPALATTSAAAARQEIAAALRQYVEMRLDLLSAALTPTDLALALAKHDVSKEIAARFSDLLLRNFNASFQAMDQSQDDIQHDASNACDVISELDEEFQSKEEDTSRSPLAVIRRWLPALLVLVAPSVMAQANPQAIEFESQLAMSQLSSASTPGEFDQTAAALSRILDQGIRNAPLLYNYGTSLLMAGRYHEALNALSRSERYSGTTWELERNMRLALRGIDDGLVIPKLPWYRSLLFWHYGLSGQTRVTIASIAVLLVWVSLLLRMVGLRDTYRTLLGVGIALLILFGSSAITTIYLELRPDASLAPPPTHTEVQP